MMGDSWVTKIGEESFEVVHLLEDHLVINGESYTVRDAIAFFIYQSQKGGFE